MQNIAVTDSLVVVRQAGSSENISSTKAVTTAWSNMQQQLKKQKKGKDRNLQFWIMASLFFEDHISDPSLSIY